MVPADVAPHEPAVVIATHALRALAVMAAFENARVELAGSQQLVADIGELQVPVSVQGRAHWRGSQGAFLARPAWGACQACHAKHRSASPASLR